MVVADGLVAATIVRAPTHIVAEQAMHAVELATPVVELDMPAVALPTAEPVAASMVAADVAKWLV
jgi:hypothetical protein